MIDPIVIAAVMQVGGLLVLVSCIAGLDMRTPVPCGLTLLSASSFVGGVVLADGDWTGIDGFILPIFAPLVLVCEYAAWRQGGDWWRST